MSNRAAIIPAAKSPLEIHDVDKYDPGSGEILVKNTSIAFNPIEWKVARLAMVPLEYPNILGNSFGGTVEAVGPDVSNFQVGDKVAIHRSATPAGAKYGAFQLYALGQVSNAVKIPDEVDIDTASSIILNFKTAASVLTGTAGLDRPSVDEVPSKGKKVLVYGGTSSLGALAIQYATQAGYSVVSTTSPKHNSFVSTLGATKLVDHIQSADAIRKALIAEGPYEVIFDTISLPPTVAILADVVKSQGGGTFYTTQPPFGPESLPEGVKRVFAPFALLLDQPQHKDLVQYLANEYLPRALAEKRLTSIPIEKVKGGISKIDDVLTRGFGGTSGVKLVLNPWEN
ncbi:chaperonin 10-like protein [Dendryphion nanum]|uniref:Chaperonin 10-like protein n=1 Tax=Dendryphion nanum TaxID=256645 RepID=A0A9P9IEF2_9PLEO|nr:chaperonin 10-like protein [Dendryphion nanum]